MSPRFPDESLSLQLQSAQGREGVWPLAGLWEAARPCRHPLGEMPSGLAGLVCGHRIFRPADISQIISMYYNSMIKLTIVWLDGRDSKRLKIWEFPGL
jgi:hypothetical protein